MNTALISPIIQLVANIVMLTALVYQNRIIKKLTNQNIKLMQENVRLSTRNVELILQKKEEKNETN